jgi:hypothetical protein
MKNKPYPALLRPSNLYNEIKKRVPKSRETIPLSSTYRNDHSHSLFTVYPVETRCQKDGAFTKHILTKRILKKAYTHEAYTHKTYTHALYQKIFGLYCVCREYCYQVFDFFVTKQLHLQ